ncbi:MAG: hypothetical protein KAT07_03860 [Calditrichia bacterium]|nr:hypothetical protein [Calditrichia bacterium]
MSDEKTHPQPLLLLREGAKLQVKESPSLFKRGIFPEGMAYAKGELLNQADH